MVFQALHGSNLVLEPEKKPEDFWGCGRVIGGTDPDSARDRELVQADLNILAEDKLSKKDLLDRWPRIHLELKLEVFQQPAYN